MTDQERNLTISRIQALRHIQGIDDETYHNMLWSWFLKYSTKFLDDEQLLYVQDVLSGRRDPVQEAQRSPISGHPDQTTPDKWRKRLMAAIAAWMKLTNYCHDEPGKDQATIIKAIACRAAGNVKSFNAIPVDRLRNLYYAFVNKRNDYESVNKINRANKSN